MNWKDAHSLLTGWQAQLKPFILHACQMLRTVTAELAGPATRLRMDLSNLMGEMDANTILSNLSGPSGNLESMGPLVGLSQVAQGKMNRETYLERYGHRGPHEMELSAPGFEEDPAWVERQLEQYPQTPLESLVAQQSAEQAAAWARFESRFPERASATRQRLERSSC